MPEFGPTGSEPGISPEGAERHGLCGQYSENRSYTNDTKGART